MYKYLIKPILFLLPPETAHQFVFSFLKISFLFPGAKFIFKKLFTIKDLQLEKNIFGLHFENTVGLAAGFDKNAKYIDVLETLGFGFIEIGTVTPLPQSGNSKPRLFRLPKDEALINRMGFNNDGADVIVDRLRKRKTKIIIGGNIGKNKITPNENAVNDYEICFEKLFDVVDYFVVNVSSPNTPGLRELQEKEPLRKILFRLQELNKKFSFQKPILLKISPDLSNEQLDDIIEIVNEIKIDGVVATNTTLSRNNLKSQISNLKSSGGLSGKPLTNRSTEIIKYISEKSKKSFPIIGVGGIHSADDAIEKLNAGASLLQIYTGFIYEGPGIIKRINEKLIGIK